MSYRIDTAFCRIVKFVTIPLHPHLNSHHELIRWRTILYDDGDKFSWQPTLQVVNEPNYGSMIVLPQTGMKLDMEVAGQRAAIEYLKERDLDFYLWYITNYEEKPLDAGMDS